jgi:hypothetical protein
LEALNRPEAEILAGPVLVLILAVVWLYRSGGTGWGASDLLVEV